VEDKLSQQEVRYREGGPNYRCGICPDFRLPGACRTVEGSINPDGVCDRFTPPFRTGGSTEDLNDGGL
jgi:hypothetical protein